MEIRPSGGHQIKTRRPGQIGSGLLWAVFRIIGLESHQSAGFQTLDQRFKTPFALGGDQCGVGQDRCTPGTTNQLNRRFAANAILVGIGGSAAAQIALEGFVDGGDHPVAKQPGGDVRPADLAVCRLGLQVGHGYADAETVEFGDDAGVAVLAGVLKPHQGVLQIRVVRIDAVPQQVEAALAGKSIR